MPFNRHTERSPGASNYDDTESGYSSAVTDHNPYTFRPDTWSVVSNPTIVISLYNLTNSGGPTYEVWLQDTDVPVRRQESRRGIIHITRLSKLLPEVIRNNVSMKEKGGYIHRTGIANSHSLVFVGSIDDISSGICHRSLKIAALDEFVLKLHDTGIFTCSLFYENYEDFSKENTTQGDNTSTPECAESIPRTSLTPQPNDSTTGQYKGISKFVCFLREELGIPPGKEWPRAEYISDILTRYLEIEEGMKRLKVWARPGKGGYRVPITHRSEFRGTNFTRTTILEAFNIGASKFSGDKSHFAPKTLANSPTARAWVKNPNGEYHDLFSRMSVSDFTRFVIDESQQSADATAALASKRHLAKG